MRVNENDDGSLNFFVYQDVLAVVKYHSPELDQASPTGWKQGKNKNK